MRLSSWTLRHTVSRRSTQPFNKSSFMGMEFELFTPLLHQRRRNTAGSRTEPPIGDLQLQAEFRWCSWKPNVSFQFSIKCKWDVELLMNWKMLFVHKGSLTAGKELVQHSNTSSKWLGQQSVSCRLTMDSLLTNLQLACSSRVDKLCSIRLQRAHDPDLI